MTEEEAKTKWCPFARVIAASLVDGVMTRVDAADAHNRVQEQGQHEPTWHGSHSCIGSECMAWRDPPIAGGGFGHGYCGLAGAPR